MPLIRKFLKDTSGNIAIMAAAAILPLIISAGLAVDYSRIAHAQSTLQSAADAAALAAAVQTSLPEAKRKKIARNMVIANYQDYPIHKIKVKFDGDKVTVIPIVKLPMAFSGLFGKNTVKIKVLAETVLATEELEVVLVLDISGSMKATLSSGKKRIDVLKESANMLLNKLEAMGNTKIKASIVPFTMNVNVGKSNTSMVDDDDNALFAGTEWKGCVMEPSKGNFVSDNPGKKFQAYIYPPMPNSYSYGAYCSINKSNGTNNGYQNMTEAANSSSMSAQFDGPNKNCVRYPLQPLTNNIAKVRTHLDNLEAHGNYGTIIGPGVTWGMRILSPDWPFEEGNKWQSGTRKIMIVLTDGEQTTEAEYYPSTCNKAKNTITAFNYSPSDYSLNGDDISTKGPKDILSPYGFIRDSDPFKSNPGSWSDVRDDLEDISLKACDEAKKPRVGGAVDVYTIGVSNDTKPGTGVYNLLRKCASSADKHYFAPDASALVGAFDDIAAKITKLRLSH